MSEEIKDQSEAAILISSKKGYVEKATDPISAPIKSNPVVTDDEPDAGDMISANSWIKLLSGRFILTVVGAICFYKFSNTICKIMVAKQDSIDTAVVISLLTNLLIIVSNIFTFYFVRKAMMNQSQTTGGTDNGG